VIDLKMHGENMKLRWHCSKKNVILQFPARGNNFIQV